MSPYLRRVGTREVPFFSQQGPKASSHIEKGVKSKDKECQASLALILHGTSREGTTRITWMRCGNREHPSREVPTVPCLGMLRSRIFGTTYYASDCALHGDRSRGCTTLAILQGCRISVRDAAVNTSTGPESQHSARLQSELRAP